MPFLLGMCDLMLLCSPGWLTHFGEDIQNPDFNDVLNDMKTILAYNNNSGSVNLYMAHGGTNFGWTIGTFLLSPGHM